MPGRLLPLFPLQVVVFPRTRLPLHIFEDRYKTMVGNAIREETEFGVVLAKEGGIVNAGCTVKVERVLKTYQDGRMDILTSGRRRFEILVLNEDEDYLQGEVEYFDDEDPAPASAELQQKTLTQYQELVELGAVRPESAPDLDDPQLSFQLAQSVSDLDFLSLLLRNRSEAARLKELNDYFSRYVPRQKQALRMKALAPLNGFGHKPEGL
ncbi:MAG: LON peptidase substrate-binding domain-containing protein [Acidobacteria bacterium]|nr:LON peptidase substrate-binding domain-containing protein [Acidobacteriota bacterium]